MIIHRYLTKEVYATMSAVLAVLMLIFLSNQLVRYLHMAAAGEISSHAVSLLLLLQLPILMAILLPLSLFLAILIAYGRHYADSEMIVLSACGFSPKRLITLSMAFSTLIFAVVLVLVIWVNPRVYAYSDKIMAGVTDSPLEFLLPNQFSSIKGKWIFYVESATRDKKELQHIFAAEEPENNVGGEKLPLGVVAAESAYQKVDQVTGNLFLVLTNGYRYAGNPGQKNYQVTKYKEYAVKVQRNDTGYKSDTSSYSTARLWLERQNPLAAAELEWRISLALSVLVLTLLAVPLSKVKPKQGRYAKLAPAVLFYIVYANLLFLARAWIKKGVLAPWLGIWWVHLLILLIASFFIWRESGFLKRGRTVN